MTRATTRGRAKVFQVATILIWIMRTELRMLCGNKQEKVCYGTQTNTNLYDAGKYL